MSARIFKAKADIEMNALGVERGYTWHYSGRFQMLFRQNEVIEEVARPRPDWIPDDEVYVRSPLSGPWWVPEHWLEAVAR